MDTTYEPPLALTIIGTIFIGVALCFSLWITADIIIRRGWRSMMAIMIPVYILNALYLFPITLWTYLKWGRPSKPVLEKRKSEIEPGAKKPDVEKGDTHDHSHMHMGQDVHEKQSVGDHAGHEMHQGEHEGHEGHQMNGQDMAGPAGHDMQHHESPDHAGHDMAMHEGHDMSAHAGHDMKMHTGHNMVDHTEHNMGEHAGHDMSKHDMGDHAGHDMSKHAGHDMSAHAGHNMSGHMMHMMDDRPMFATITVAVCHCGAGCLLGDIVGEWLVFGTNASINGRSIWVEWLVDYGFALLFGIVFQYWSIAPMSGEYGPKTLWRAAKADFLSLTFFEVGLFGWMAIFQIAIWKDRLGMDNVVYWWMMQVGMFLGHWTAFPVNWWLIKNGIKEPCA